VLAQLGRDPAARLWPQCRRPAFRKGAGPQGRPDNLAAPQRWTLMSETLRELRRTWHAHRGRQMTLEGIACLITRIHCAFRRPGDYVL
jgi:hypothetical protein